MLCDLKVTRRINLFGVVNAVRETGVGSGLAGFIARDEGKM